MIAYDKEGLWSLTLPEDAELICDIIKKEFKNTNDLIVFDGTGGIGGNTIAFGKNFTKVISYEINKDRYKLLKHNIKLHNLSNIEVINGDSTKNLSKIANVYFFDPPWGGPNYKIFDKLTLKLGNKSLIDIVKEIQELNNGIIMFKLPYNYDLSEFNLNYKLIKIKNYLLIITIIEK